MTDIRFVSQQINIKFVVNGSQSRFSVNTRKIVFGVSQPKVKLSISNRPITFRTQLGSAGGVKSHPALVDRDLLDQHPIEAITGLRDALDDIVIGGHTHLVADITDFDSGVSGSVDVAANTSARHNRLHAWNSIEDHSGLPLTFPPDTHDHVHDVLDGVTPDNHHNEIHNHVSVSEGGRISHIVLDDKDAADSHPHSTLSGMTENDHHSKVHEHDGIDGSGLLSHAVLTDKTLINQHPHSAIYNLGPDDHHNKVHTHADDGEGGLIGLEQARLNGNTMLGDIIMDAGSIKASPEGIQLDTSGTPPTTETEGQLYWNPDDETVNFVLKDGVVGQVFEEGFSLVKNQTGAPLLNGKAIMFAGALGASGRLKAAYGIADNTISAVWTLGIATQDIEDGGDGRITVRGKVRGIDTTGTPYGETWVDGDVIYMSAVTPGALTKVPPEAPDLQITMAAVISAHATSGVLYVRPTWRGKLVDLDDVNGTPVTTTGQIPVWDNAAQYFDFSHNIIDIEQKIDDHIEKIDGILADTNEPNGFNRNNPDTMGILTFNEGTRLLSLAVAGGQSEFYFYSNGVKFTKTATESITITDVDDKHYIYFDEAGVLQHSVSFDVNYILKYALVSIIYWNTIAGEAIIYANEQHGVQMDGATHLRRHATAGAAYSTGLNIDGLIAGSPTYTQTTSGVFFDEDIMQIVAAEAVHPFFYRTGASGVWNKSAPINDVSYGGGGVIYYNEWTGTIWQLTATTGYVIYHFIATNDTRNVITKIVGQGTYVNKTIARAAIETEIHDLALGGLPTPEFIFLYSVIADNSGNVVALSDGSTFVDFRESAAVGGGGASGTSQYHSDLLGVTVNDHHNEAHQHDDFDGSTRFPYVNLTDKPTSLGAINNGEYLHLMSIEAGAQVNTVDAGHGHSALGYDGSETADVFVVDAVGDIVHWANKLDLGYRTAVEAKLSIGGNRLQAGVSKIRLHGNDGTADGLDIIRESGFDADSVIAHYGSGNLIIHSIDAGSGIDFVLGSSGFIAGRFHEDTLRFELSGGISIEGFFDDDTLGGTTPSAVRVPTVRAVKDYVDSNYSMNDHAHDGIDGSGTVSYDDLTEKPANYSGDSNYGFDNIPNGFLVDSDAGTPVGWELESGSADIAKELSYYDDARTGSVGRYSYGADSHIGQAGGTVNWFGLSKYFQIKKDSETLKVFVWAKPNSASSINFDGVFVLGSETFLGEDDAYISTYFYDKDGIEIIPALNINHSTSACHQDWELNGPISHSLKWLPVEHTITVPAGTKFIKVRLTSSENNNVVTALGYLGANSAVRFDDFSIIYQGDLIEISSIPSFVDKDETGLGKVGNQSTYTINSAQEWADLPVGFSRLLSTASVGLPEASYGYFTKIANKDNQTGWGGIWVHLTTGKTYTAYASDGTALPLWQEIWGANNDGVDSGLDADLLQGYDSSKSNVIDTVARRDGSGDLLCRLLRSEYTSTSATVGWIMTQQELGTSNNYMRPTTPAQFRAAVTDAYYLGLGGGTITGTLKRDNASTGSHLFDWFTASTTTGKMWKVTDQGGLAIGCDSSMFLHAGDSTLSHVADAGIIAGTTTERIHLAADESIYFHSNLQAGWASRYEMKWLNSGYLQIASGVAINKFSNDVLTGSSVSLPTENSVKNYVDSRQYYDDDDWNDSYSRRYEASYSPASYFTAGEYIELFKVTPSGSSQNYVFKGTVYCSSGANVSILDFEFILRSNTLPSTTRRLRYNKIYIGAGTDITLVMWQDDITGEISVVIKHVAGSGMNLGFSCNGYFRGTYYDNVTVNDIKSSDTTVVPDGFVEEAGSGVTLTYKDSQRIELSKGVEIDEFSNDGGLSGNSDLAIPTEKAVKTYVDAVAGGGGGSPVGTIISWIGGYFTAAGNSGFTNVLANTIADVNTLLNGEGWYVCDGTELNDSGSSIFNGAGRYLPNLTDDRFVQGDTAAGIVGGESSNSHTHTLVHTHTLTHTHTIAHTHAGPNHYHSMQSHTHYHNHASFTSGQSTLTLASMPYHRHYTGFTYTNVAYTAPTSYVGLRYGTNATAVYTNYQGSSSWHTHSVDPGGQTSGGPSSTNTGYGGTGTTGGSSAASSGGASTTTTSGASTTTTSAASDTENRPKFLSCFYLMKVK